MSSNGGEVSGAYCFIPAPCGPAFGAARSLVALSVAMTLLASPASTLFHPITGLGSFPKCEGVANIGLFCLVSHTQLDLWRLVAAAALLLIATGWRPRITSIPLAWLCFSFHSGISIPDGGDQVALILGLLLLPAGLADARVWHWSRPMNNTSSRGNRAGALIGGTVLFLARLQVCAIYFQACIAKLAVQEWTDGTALYYWINSPTFGPAGWLQPALSPIIDNSIGVTVLTWGPLLLEFSLAVSVLRPSRRLRAILLPVGVAFHVTIAVVMGLWSFCVVMSAALLLLLVPIGSSVQDLYSRRRSNSNEMIADCKKQKLEPAVESSEASV